jgi:hypothetical protein
MALAALPYPRDPLALHARGHFSQKMIDEVMAQLARLLPLKYRSVCADLESATREFLIFD